MQSSHACGDARLARSMRATLALLCWLVVASKAGAEARISDFKIALEGPQVLASVTLEGAFNHHFVERLESGLPTSILYRFELDRDRKHWWDQRLLANTYEVVAMYDAEARTYTVHFRLDDKLIESRTVRDLKALAAVMCHVERVPVFALGGREDRQRLLLKARAELGMRTLLSFIPVVITTDWVESSKFRSPPPK
jgi:hypothetical protein